MAYHIFTRLLSKSGGKPENMLLEADGTLLPIGWVLTRDPEGKCEPKAYFSTNQGIWQESVEKP
jgi:hypothetical protein